MSILRPTTGDDAAQSGSPQDAAELAGVSYLLAYGGAGPHGRGRQPIADLAMA